MNDPKHPKPWVFSVEDGCPLIRDANGTLVFLYVHCPEIVTACNAHDDLYAMLGKLCCEFGREAQSVERTLLLGEARALLAALAKAAGGTE